MNTSRKGAKVLALLLGATLVAAACGGDDDEGSGGDTDATTATTDEGTGEETAGGSIGYAQEQEFDTYNNNTASANTLKNTVVLNEVLPNAFQFANTGDLEMDEALMVSAEVTSESPQVVEYVVQPDAAWEDGDPIDCDDFKLHWVALSSQYYAKNADGTVQKDPETGLDLLLFDGDSPGFNQIESVDCSADGKTITTNFSEPFADWKGMFQLMVPAHVVERESGVADVVAAIDAKNEADLAKAAEFWSTGFVLNPGELKPEILPSGGPFKLASWEAGASLTLERNPNYWGEPAKADSIVVRQIPQEAQVQALANQEVNIIEPQPSVDVKAQLDGTSGVTASTEDGFTYEHLDFDFRNTDLQDPEIRRAFALCVPRQQIIDQLIKPLNPDAVIMQHRWTFPFQDAYEDTSGGGFDKVDIAGAKAILDRKGKAGLTLQIGHIVPNQRRTDTVALVKASCDQAGFVIQDAPYETFFDDGGELDTGEGWDVALFAWIGSPLVSGSSTTFTTGGSNNRGTYSNPEVDALVPQINTELDPEAQNELVNQVDTILWEDLATIPLFVHPDIFAFSDGIEGAIYNPTQAQASWNARQWSIT